MLSSKKKIIILISGRGSNMKNLILSELPGKIVLVASNNPDAEGLEVAKSLRINTDVINHRKFKDRVSFDLALATKLAEYEPDLILLAGFMRILSDTFLSQFTGKILNIHPSLLPSFPGTKTHSNALKSGVRIHGCTVHFVTTQLDAGPIIIQAAVPVMQIDTPESLATRVLREEHKIYPMAVRWFLEDRLSILNNKVLLDDEIQKSGSLIFPFSK